MPVSINYAELLSLNPCKGGLSAAVAKFGNADTWGGARVTAQHARASGVSFDDMLWVASALARRDEDIERRLRLWLADCAARVLHIYEKAGASPAPRDAIIASRQFARGAIGDAARAAAWAAARAAAWDAARAAAWDAARDAAGDAAWDAAWAAAWDAARDAAGDAAWDAAWDAARAAAWAAAWDAAWAAETQWQFDRLVARLGEGEPEDWPLRERKAPNP